jgi:4-hydroxy-2-oxoheptanedioate aldolase
VRAPSLRAALAAGPPLLATFSLLPSPAVVELVGAAGFDLVIVDTEHGPHSLTDVHAAVLAGAACGLPVLVRVPGADPVGIGRVLDLGAAGVLVPHVDAAAAAAAVVRAARFAPAGERGANPYVRAGGYGDPGVLAARGAEVAVLVMVEGAGGAAAVPEILAVPGLDGIFLGPVDLSHSLGLPGQPEHPRVVGMLRAVAEQAAAAGVAAAAFAPGPERARDWLARGLRLVACGVDTALALDGLARCVRAVRAGGP